MDWPEKLRAARAKAAICNCADPYTCEVCAHADAMLVTYAGDLLAEVARLREVVWGEFKKWDASRSPDVVAALSRIIGKQGGGDDKDKYTPPPQFDYPE